MPSRQQGFLTLPLAGYAALAAGAVILGLSLALKVQSSRLDSANADLEACATRYETALKSIAAQNEAVRKLSEDSQKRQKQAAAALVKARTAQASLDSEIKRLRGINAALLDCRGAVAAAKEGLKP